jgi:DNA (cytosine-5)-methyltransferase 1
VPKAYYSEWDPYAAQWLRNLIDAGHIAPGDVDERSIVDVRPDDLRGYTQCHFFAGIAGWSYALRLAAWDDSRPVWTGSCPCQPFSAAGKGQASGDERHLWPVWFELIKSCKPSTIFGEQVEAAIGWGWLDLVYSDLEQEGYAVGSAVLPACSVGAPHIRQRLWFVADSGHGDEHDRREVAGAPESAAGEIRHQRLWSDNRPSSATGELAEPESEQSHRGGHARRGRGQSANDSFWCDLIWLPCSDGKQRPTGKLVYPEGKQVGLPGCSWEPGEARGQRTVESIIQPLAHGVSARVAKLRAAGNAIVPQIASEFIKACSP